MLRDQSVPVGLGRDSSQVHHYLLRPNSPSRVRVINRHCGAPVYYLADIASVPTDEKHSRFFHRVPQQIVVHSTGLLAF